MCVANDVGSSCQLGSPLKRKNETQKVNIFQPAIHDAIRNRHTGDSTRLIYRSAIVVHDFISRSRVLNPAGPPGSRGDKKSLIATVSNRRSVSIRRQIINRFLVAASLHHRWISAG